MIRFTASLLAIACASLAAGGAAAADPAPAAGNTASALLPEDVASIVVTAKTTRSARDLK